MPRNILILCLGNICRSPYVEAYLRKEGGALGFEVASGGFMGPGRPAPPEAREAAARRGVDTGNHLSRLVDREVMEAADLIILVDPAHGPLLRRTLGPHDKPVLVLGDLDTSRRFSEACSGVWIDP